MLVRRWCGGSRGHTKTCDLSITLALSCSRKVSRRSCPRWPEEVLPPGMRPSTVIPALSPRRRAPHIGKGAHLTLDAGPARGSRNVTKAPLRLRVAARRTPRELSPHGGANPPGRTRTHDRPHRGDHHHQRRRPPDRGAGPRRRRPEPVRRSGRDRPPAGDRPWLAAAPRNVREHLRRQHRQETIALQSALRQAWALINELRPPGRDRAVDQLRTTAPPAPCRPRRTVEGSGAETARVTAGFGVDPNATLVTPSKGRQIRVRCGVS
jgi:hypothetical protein